MDSQKAKLLTDIYSAHNYDRFDFVGQRSKDSFIYDPEGNRIFDCLGGYSAIAYGHNWDVPRNALIRELTDSMSQSDLTSNVIYTVPYAEFCETICEFTEYDRVFAKSDGGSVTESVLTVFRLHAKKRGICNPEVLVIEHCFHGRGGHFQNVSAGKETVNPKMVVVAHSAEAVRAAINKNTIGILMEIHRGEGGPLFDKTGVYPAIHKVIRECEQEYGQRIWIVDDEIQTGLDRCGHRMSFQKFGQGCRPDAVTLGKALGGGIMPVSALVGTHDFMKVITPGSDGSTFGGFPPACSVATAVLKHLENYPLGDRACEIGECFADNLAGIPHVTVEYEGALIGVKFKGIKSTKPICHEALSGHHGRPRALIKDGHVYGDVAHTRIAVPMGTTTDEMIDEHCEKTLRPIFAQVSEMIDNAKSLPIDVLF